MADDLVLHAEQLSRRFRSGWALRGCDLALPRGKVAALVGANGAGKTTLLMLATGLLRPTAGRITVLGSDPSRSGMPPGASLLAQHRPLYPRFTVRETIAGIGRLNPGGWDAPYVTAQVTGAGIDPAARVGELSAGQRARVALALALGRRPELLLLDEPLAELDPLARAEVLGTILAEAAGTGMSVLMSSHVLADLDEACDHLVLVHGGQVALDGAIADLLDEHRVLVGPSSGIGDTAGVVHSSVAGRQVTALVRGDVRWAGFQDQRATLDDIVLGHLRAGAA